MINITLVLQRIVDEALFLLEAPVLFPEMLWTVTPLICTWLALTLYFGTYRREELGWNTALSNSIVLLFVFLELMREIVQYTSPESWKNLITFYPAFIIILIVIIEALLLFYNAFMHKWPKKIMFFIASPLPINIQAYIISAIVYTQMRPTWYTLGAAVLLFIALLLATRLLQYLTSGLIKVYHEYLVMKIKQMREDRKQVEKSIKKAKKDEKEGLKEYAKNLKERADSIEKKLKKAEKRIYGKLRAAKKL